MSLLLLYFILRSTPAVDTRLLYICQDDTHGVSVPGRDVRSPYIVYVTSS